VYANNLWIEYVTVKVVFGLYIENCKVEAKHFLVFSHVRINGCFLSILPVSDSVMQSAS
jgi:hypothetical protein